MFFLIFYVISGIFLVATVTSYAIIIFSCQKKANLRIESENSIKAKRKLLQAPGPRPWPIIGNLDIIGQFNNPFQGFGALTKNYGDIYSLTLGHTRCLVVNNLDLIKEVLNKNGKFFGGRPEFLRYHKLFGGDRNNCEYFLNHYMLVKCVISLYMHLSFKF